MQVSGSSGPGYMDPELGHTGRIVLADDVMGLDISESSDWSSAAATENSDSPTLYCQ